MANDWITDAARDIVKNWPHSPFPDEQVEGTATIIEEAWERSIADAVPADLGAMLDEAQEQRRVAEVAIVRCRQGWCNVIDLGILPPQHHAEARQIIAELTAALAKMGSKATLR